MIVGLPCETTAIFNPLKQTIMHYGNLPIKSWAVEDRPREKMLQRGISALTDAELLAIILGQGTVTMDRRYTALDLARQLIEETGGLDRLARSDVQDLIRVKGIGKAKAIAIVSAFELGRRKLSGEMKPIRVTDASVVAGYLKPKMADLDQEVFHILFLNRNHEIKGERQIFKGGVSATIIDPKIVFKEAINHLASAIVLAHNHPSGNIQPSIADIEITRQLVEAGKLVDIKVLDHLIISERGYYSFADEGRIG